ncbi:MAG: hypothetical protein IH850_09150 [Acidobacteria bacterium]|nr:hypothetical protein [Acidobacteriota bacterium]
MRAAKSPAFRAINEIVTPIIKADVGSPPPIGAGIVVLETIERQSTLPRQGPLISLRPTNRVVVSTLHLTSQGSRDRNVRLESRVWINGRAIRRFQPRFTYQPSDEQITAFILRDLVPAGLFIGEVRDDGSIQVKLDYVIPQYRDFKVGRYLYSPRSGLCTDVPCSSA